MYICHTLSHPVGIALQWSHHPHEEGLLQECKHSTNHGLHARQSAKVIGWVAKYTYKQLEDKTNSKYNTYPTYSGFFFYSVL